MVCCDECDKGYHSFCVGLADIPDGEGERVITHTHTHTHTHSVATIVVWSIN